MRMSAEHLQVHGGESITCTAILADPANWIVMVEIPLSDVVGKFDDHLVIGVVIAVTVVTVSMILSFFATR